jgi:nicotinate-nucleotide adenylyltransferase
MGATMKAGRGGVEGNMVSVVPCPGSGQMLNSLQMKLGLYGGSFDPVHLGHLLVARAAHEELGLDRVVFIPAAQSPFKPGHLPTPGATRAMMLRMALQGLPWASLDLLEIERGGVSYTVDTLRHFRSAQPDAELFYLIGGDHAPSLPQWKDAATLAALAQFVVIPRPGSPAPALPDPFHGESLRGFPLGVSSSELRARVGSGKSIRFLTPDAVGEAIATNRLYL